MTIFDAFSILAKIKAIEDQVKLAPVGAVVDGGLVRGLKVKGRECDLPVGLIVRR